MGPQLDPQSRLLFLLSAVPDFKTRFPRAREGFKARCGLADAHVSSGRWCRRANRQLSAWRALSLIA